MARMAIFAIKKMEYQKGNLYFCFDSRRGFMQQIG
jgi:hypothetical protein